MAARGVLKDLNRRLERIYKESGGINESELDNDPGVDTKKLSKFDLLKLSSAKKITKVKENLKERDDLVEKGKGRTTDCIKLSNDIKKMIMSIKFDYDELEKELEDSRKKNMKKNPDYVLQQQQDLELIKKHIESVEKASKQRGKKPGGRRKRRDRDNDAEQQSLMEGAVDGNMGANMGGIGSGGGSLVMQNVIKEQDLEGGGENLPEIDISEALQKLDKMKEEVDKALDKVSEQLDILKDKTKDISNAVDASLQQLDKIEEKVDDRNEELKKLNADIEKKIGAVSNTTIYVIVLILIIVLIVLVAIAYIVVGYILIMVLGALPI